MTRIVKTIVGRRSAAGCALRRDRGLAAMLAGCYTHAAAVAERAYPDDYRERHPITMQGRRAAPSRSSSAATAAA